MNSPPPAITTLAEALVGADVFLGVSKADVLTPEMVRTMSGNPIVMALANPDPEIAYDTAMVLAPDIIFATGRSDYPNQVNNVLGFPYIFRGALDVRATKINEEMKLAAAHALAELTQAAGSGHGLRAYGVDEPRIRAHLPDSQTARSAPAVHRRPRRCEGRRRIGRRQKAHHGLGGLRGEPPETLSGIKNPVGSTGFLLY